jgi:hypothetical protein
MKLHVVLLLALVSWTAPTASLTLDTGSDGSSDLTTFDGPDGMTFEERMKREQWRHLDAFSAVLITHCRFG